MGLAVLGLVSSGLLGLFPAPLRFLLTIGALVFLPGELVLRVLRHRSSGAIRIALGFAAGVSAACAVAWLCRVVGASFSAYVGVVQLFSAVFLAAMLTERPGARAAAEANRTAPGAPGRWGSVAALVVALFVAVSFVIVPPPIRHEGDVFVPHISLVRGIMEENRLAPDGPLAAPVYARDEPERTDPRGGSFHPVLAAIARLSGLEPLEVWRWLPIAIAPVAVLAFVGFAGALLPGPGYVAFAVALFLMFQGGIGTEFFGTLGYGQNLSLVFFWLFVVVAMQYALDGLGGGLALAGLIVFGGSLVHADVIIHCALGAAAFVLFRKAFGFTTRRLIALSVIAAVSAGVVGVWRVATSYQPGNILHSHPQGLLYFFDIGDRFFVPSPAEIVRKNGLLFFTALLIAPFLLSLRRHRRYGLMGFALWLPPVVTALNPFVCPLLYGRIHYLVHRFLLGVPAFVITALGVGALVSYAWKGGVARRVLCAFLIFLWAKTFLIAAGGWYDHARAARRSGAAPPVSAEVRDAVRFINERVPAKSVVLSDVETSYAFAALTHAKVVAVPGQHGDPGDRYPLERLSAVHTVLSPFSGQVETLAALRKFGVGYVVVNGSLENSYEGFLAEWDPGLKPVLEAKLGSLKAVFQEVYATDKVVIYRVENGPFERLTWEPAVPYLDEPRHPVETCRAAGGTASATVAELGIEPRESLPAETVRVTVGYRGGTEEATPFPVTLRLRFEDRSYFDNAPRFPGDKYVRRFRERQEGAFRRFRIDHEPFYGYWRVAQWPADRIIYEEFEVRLPRALGETVYEVRWQLAEETLLPNFALRDFLFNQDSYEGAPCAEVRIRRQIVR